MSLSLRETDREMEERRRGGIKRGRIEQKTRQRYKIERERVKKTQNSKTYSTVHIV